MNPYLQGKLFLIQYILHNQYILRNFHGGDYSMGMSDKQYDGLLLDTINDWDDVIELLEAKEYDKALTVAQKKRAKNQNKLESPNGNI